MKKIIAFMLTVLMLTALSACGSEKAVEVQPTAEPEMIVTPVIEANETARPAEETEKSEQGPMDIALSLVDHDISELYEAIGEPSSSEYAPSCLVEGADDGILTYDGFNVYTIRTAEKETVYDVE